MVQYRLLERLDPNQEWQPDGVAYMEEGICLFYRLDQIMRQSVMHLTELGELHFPYEKGSTFRWGEIKEWHEIQPFTPKVILQPSFAKPQTEKRKRPYPISGGIPPEIKALLAKFEYLTKQQEIRLKEDFIIFVESGYSPPQPLVEAFWRRWATGHGDPPFIKPEHNIALLLYARVFDLPVEKYPAQNEYLFRYKELYAPFKISSGGWGARASLSKNVLAMLDSPVLQVWVYKEADIPQRIIIIGKGLAAHRDKVFSDALVTAMRVQASDRDIFNDGLIAIERKVEEADALDVNLPVLGANAPLAGANTAEAAMRELIHQLRHLEQNTGFVQIHEVDRKDAEHLHFFLGQLALKAKETGDPILWAPDPDKIDTVEELVILQPVLKLFQEEHYSGRRRRISPVELSLSPELLAARSWERLFKTYYEEVIERIAMDAQIRWDYYQRRAKGLRAEKDQWDKADDPQRLQRWGPTMTLNQRFDDATGLTIWLQPPVVVATKQYFEENVPGLIRGYEEWAAKMRGILDSLRTASKRPDAPFRRLITTRFFDAALRGCEPELTPRMQKLYREWATPMADLLRFAWRQQLGLIRANPEDLFTNHTTFNLVQFGEERDDGGVIITELAMTPFTLFDIKRSVAVFDPKRRFMIANDSSDYPEKAPPLSVTTDDLQQELLQKLNNNENIAGLVKLLQEKLLQDPQQVSRQIINLLRPPINIHSLSKDLEQVIQANQAGLSNASFPRLIDHAESAMSNRALLTARKNLEEARDILPDLLQRWHELRQPLHQERPIPEQRDLECRLYLLIAIAECLATDHLVKEYLPAIYRAPQSGGRVEIRDALVAADDIHPQYTQEWIESLSEWDLDRAYKRLIRDMPREQDLTTTEQYSAMRALEVVELMQLADELYDATATLDSVQETRASALIKLGPALERAILSYAANVVYGELVWLLEILTGRQVAFERGI